MKKTGFILLAILVVIAVLFTLRFVVGGPEDNWLCQNGEWIKHGEPVEPKPDTGCGQQTVLNNFADCLAAGYPIMESYPRQCRDSQGNLFVENIGNELEKTDLIRLDNPRPNQAISSPLTVSGQARGTWFFEASFPIVLADWDGLIIAQGYAQAKSDWMTEDFVEFTGELEFTKPNLYDYGTLILRKDNPSGLPENDDALEIPIKFN